MKNQAILVTGASSGIGRATALRLAKSGFKVFAGVRNEVDAVGLSREAVGQLIPLQLDVTNETSIREAARLVAKSQGEAGLHGLVNNAGIAVLGALEYLPLEDLRHQFEVNIIGQLAVTQALLPQLRPTKGRIIFISSVAGRTKSIPFLGPYSASKYAIEALGDSLRLELAPSGLRVTLIAPGSIATPNWLKVNQDLKRILETLPPEGQTRYEHAIQFMADFARKTGERGLPPEKVAQKVEQALTVRRPKARYLVGMDVKMRVLLENQLPDGLRDAILTPLFFGR